ncbi:hypothetical protein [Candidatus Villigracilis affinis]|uniref:hypothetical protein n=1 Tax=Candidatus Villigracilis affinis TaxID=3140682 RepID=UPI001D532AB8|nr:hypothetical protein [Anaerolineales bacterium]
MKQAKIAPSLWNVAAKRKSLSFQEGLRPISRGKTHADVQKRIEALHKKNRAEWREVPDGYCEIIRHGRRDPRANQQQSALMRVSFSGMFCSLKMHPFKNCGKNGWKKK